MDHEPRPVDGNNEFRMHYTDNGVPNTILWKPEAGFATPGDFAVFLMSQVRPECDYKDKTAKGMAEVLLRNGISVQVSPELNYGPSHT